MRTIDCPSVFARTVADARTVATIAAGHDASDPFSRRAFTPTHWHHVVGQSDGYILELYVDGELVGTSPALLNAVEGKPLTTACRLLVGRLKERSLPPDYLQIRPFEGRLDELAVYDQPLTPQEIRQHHAFRRAE